MSLTLQVGAHDELVLTGLVLRAARLDAQNRKTVSSLKSADHYFGITGPRKQKVQPVPRVFGATSLEVTEGLRSRRGIESKKT